LLDLTNYWIPVLPIIGALMCSLGYTVYRDNPKSWTNRYFCLLTCSIGIWMFLWVVNEIYVSKYVGMEVDPYPFIIFLYETQFYFIALVGPFFLLTILEISGFVNSDNRFKILGVIMVFPLINYILLSYSIIAGHEWMHLYGQISDGSFAIAQGPLFQYYHVPYNYVMILMSYAILIWKAVKPRYILERSQAVTLLLGSLLGVIGNIVTITGTNPLTGMYYVDPTFLGFGGTVVVYGYAIWKHRLIRIAPEVEGEREGEATHSLEGGKFYVTTDVEKGFEIFAELVHHGTPGIAFTSKDRKDLKEKYELEKTPVVTLSEQVGRDTLNPGLEEHAEMIPFLITDFVDQTDESVVILHDLDRWMDKPVDKLVTRSVFSAMNHLDEQNCEIALIKLLKELEDQLDEHSRIIIVVSEHMEIEISLDIDSNKINTL